MINVLKEPSDTHIKTSKEEILGVVREGVGAGGRNDPSLVCTYE
jgi:hypothetical protein